MKGDIMNVLKSFFLHYNKILFVTFGYLIFISDIAFAEGEATHSEPDYIALLFVFMLSTFIGLGVVTRVSRLLHTPLMSLTNAISAIAVVGSLILTGMEHPDYITILGAIALFASMTNIVSGFMITDRMLKMFKSKETKKS
jgi:H+-translocating NAD(P) transhydrogenase subunit alpha